MTHELLNLILASGCFVGTHFVLSSIPVRDVLIARLRATGFMAFYSLVALASFYWMTDAYIRAPEITLFTPGVGMKHLSLSVMAFACFLLVCGYTQPNATAVGMEKPGLKAGPRGVLKLTRHPVMWAVALWAFCHLLASGHAAAFVYFGALVVLAIGGAWHIDKRKKLSGGAEWDAYLAQTSLVPMAAIAMGKTRVEKGEYRWWQILLSVLLYAGLLFAHEPVVGRYVLPF